MPATAITTAPSVLIRAARGSDGAALERLAALDSAAVPAGTLLVAEADGALVAAHRDRDRRGDRRPVPPHRRGDRAARAPRRRRERPRGRRNRAERLGLRLAPHARTA